MNKMMFKFVFTLFTYMLLLCGTISCGNNLNSIQDALPEGTSSAPLNQTTSAKKLIGVWEVEKGPMIAGKGNKPRYYPIIYSTNYEFYKKDGLLQLDIVTKANLLKRDNPETLEASATFLISKIHTKNSKHYFTMKCIQHIDSETMASESPAQQPKVHLTSENCRSDEPQRVEYMFQENNKTLILYSKGATKIMKKI